MRGLALICILVVFSGCGKRSAQLTTHEFDGELSTYLEKFLAAAAEHGRADVADTFVVVQAGIVTRESGGSAAGVCVTADGEAPTVTVDAALWPTLTAVQKRGVLFHELGHCLLGREHKEGLMPGKACTVSVMSTPLPLQSCLYLFEEEYDRELFTSH